MTNILDLSCLVNALWNGWASLPVMAAAFPVVVALVHYEFYAYPKLRQIANKAEGVRDAWTRTKSAVKVNEDPCWAKLNQGELLADLGHARIYFWCACLAILLVFEALIGTHGRGCVSSNVELTTFGAAAYTFGQMIWRISSGALFGRFLLVAALRTGVAVLIAAGLDHADALSVVFQSSAGKFVYFLIGLFPLWALDTLGKKARAVFERPEDGTEALSVSYIEGVDGAVYDRLLEIGITDVQHMATSSPFDVALMTFCSHERALDWIDQAILIQSVKKNIVAFRALGIRCAVEFKIVYDRAHAAEPSAEAVALLGEIARRCELAPSAIDQVGRNLSEDKLVNCLWLAWQSPERT